jgi:hypothetical protein
MVKKLHCLLFPVCHCCGHPFVASNHILPISFEKAWIWPCIQKTVFCFRPGSKLGRENVLELKQDTDTEVIMWIWLSLGSPWTYVSGPCVMFRISLECRSPSSYSLTWSENTSSNRSAEILLGIIGKMFSHKFIYLLFPWQCEVLLAHHGCWQRSSRMSSSGFQDISCNLSLGWRTILLGHR